MNAEKLFELMNEADEKLVELSWEEEALQPEIVTAAKSGAGIWKIIAKAGCAAAALGLVLFGITLVRSNIVTAPNSSGSISQNINTEGIQETAFNIGFNDFKYDTKSMLMPNSENYSLTHSHLYIHNKNVNLSTGEVQTHPTFQNGIGTIDGVGYLIGARDGFYYEKFGKLYFEDLSGNSSIIFENDFCTAFEEDFFGDSLSSRTGNVKNGDFSALENTSDYLRRYTFTPIFRDDIMYVIGGTYIYKVDLNTMTKISEPVVISNSFIRNADISGNYLWASNDDYELICCNMESGEISVFESGANRLMCSGGKVYYLIMQKENNIVLNDLYTRNADGSAPELLKENVCFSFYATENSLYYSGTDGAYLCDLNGENDKKLDLPEYVFNSAAASNNMWSLDFFSTDSCNTVFIIIDSLLWQYENGYEEQPREFGTNSPNAVSSDIYAVKKETNHCVFLAENLVRP